MNINRFLTLLIAIALIVVLALAVRDVFATNVIASQTDTAQTDNVIKCNDLPARYSINPGYGCQVIKPANRFAGTWSGTMSFSDDPNRKEDIVVTIPSGCAVGSVCGNIDNTTVSCQWEMTLVSVNGNVFEYTFSKMLSGECPALGGGTLTLQSDGTLMREHKTPDFTASGLLWIQHRTR